MAAKPWQDRKPKGSLDDDVMIGTAAKDRLDGRGGDDFLDGRGGDDNLSGGTGADELNGGAGSDVVRGAEGADLLAYVAAENAGERDVYDGGSERDTLVLELTRAEWMDPAFQADLALHLAHIASGSDKAFRYSAFDLSVSSVEALEILVDGVAISPADDPVTLADDALKAGEKTPSAAINVLANDLVPDLVRSVTHSQPEHGKVELSADLTDPSGAARASFVYRPDPAHWSRLGAGETGQDTFTYTVTDADGDTRTATVTVTVAGVNDAPVFLQAGSETTGGVVEDGASVATGSLNFQDVDLNDTHRVQVSSPEGAFGVLETGLAGTAGDADPNGRVDWRFSVDDAALQTLSAGETVRQTYEVSVSDAAGARAVQTVTITLTGVNDRPVANGELAGVTLEDTPLILDPSVLLANDRDADRLDTLSLAGLGEARHGTVGLDALGRIVFVPDTDFSGVAEFDYTVSDGQGGTATATARVTVTPALKAPNLTVQPATGREDAPIALKIDAALVEAEPGDTLSVVIRGVPAGAVLSAGAKGAEGEYVLSLDQLRGLTITPSSNSDADFTLTVTAVARDGGTAARTEASLSVDVTGVADAPVLDLGPETSLIGGAAVEVGAGKSTYFPNLVPLEDGGYVVFYGDVDNVWGARFDAQGRSVGAEFQVNQSVGGGSRYVTSATRLDDGGLIVTWTGQVGDVDFDVFARRYTPDGRPLGNEFRINAAVGDREINPQVVALRDGGFVVAWESELGRDGYAGGIYAQRFDAAGGRVGAEFRVNTTTYEEQNQADLAALADGGFVVVWTSAHQSGFGSLRTEVMAQRFDALARRVGGEFMVNTYTPYEQQQPTVTGLEDGGFVIGWTSANQIQGFGVFAQRYSAGGERVGSEFAVSPVGAHLSSPVLAAAPDGGFLFAWSTNQFLGQSFDAAGAKVGGIFELNAPTRFGEGNGGGASTLTPIAYLEDGSLAAGWMITGHHAFDRDMATRVLRTGPAPVRGQADSDIALDIKAGLADVDGSETLLIRISGVPQGALLSAGRLGDDGVWTLSLAQLKGLSVRSAPGSSADFELTVTAVSTELNGGSAELTKRVLVIVDPAASAAESDGRLVSPSDVEVAEVWAAPVTPQPELWLEAAPPYGGFWLEREGAPAAEGWLL